MDLLGWLFPPLGIAQLISGAEGTTGGKSYSTGITYTNDKATDSKTGQELTPEEVKKRNDEASAPKAAAPIPGGGIVQKPPQVMPTRSEEEWQQWAKDFGNRYFAEGSAGRLDVAPSAGAADVLARRKAGLEGFSADENSALRENMALGIGRGEQTALRQLRGVQGAQGIRGGLAAAQQADVLKKSNEAKTQAERDLFIQNILQRQQALDKYAGTVSDADKAKQAIDIFNLAQKEKEVGGQASAELTGMNLSQADLASSQMANALAAQAATPAPVATPVSTVVKAAGTPEELERRKRLLGSVR